MYMCTYRISRQTVFASSGDPCLALVAGTRRLHIIYAKCEKKNTIDGGRQNGSTQFPAQGLRVHGSGTDGGGHERVPSPSPRTAPRVHVGEWGLWDRVETNSFTAAAAAGAPPVPGRPTPGTPFGKRYGGWRAVPQRWRPMYRRLLFYVWASSSSSPSPRRGRLLRYRRPESRPFYPARVVRLRAALAAHRAVLGAKQMCSHDNGFAPDSGRPSARRWLGRGDGARQ